MDTITTDVRKVNLIKALSAIKNSAVKAAEEYDAGPTKTALEDAVQLIEKCIVTIDATRQ